MYFHRHWREKVEIYDKCVTRNVLLKKKKLSDNLECLFTIIRLLWNESKGCVTLKPKCLINSYVAVSKISCLPRTFRLSIVETTYNCVCIILSILLSFLFLFYVSLSFRDKKEIVMSVKKYIHTILFHQWKVGEFNVSAPKWWHNNFLVITRKGKI